MKNKVEIYILAAVIIILSTYIFLREDRNINYSIPKLSRIDRDEISKIDFANMTFIKEGSNWILPSGYRASHTIMNRITTELAGIKIIDMISQSKDYSRFGITEDQLLKVYTKAEPDLVMQIGDTSSTESYTYIKLDKDENIYSIRGDIKELLNKSEDELRDRTVLSFSNGQTVSIEIEDQIINLDREKSIGILTILNELKATSFKELPRDEVLLSVSISGDETASLIIYKQVNSEYPATSSYVDYPFTLPELIINKLLEAK